MLRNLIAFCLSRRPLVLLLFFAFLGAGWFTFQRLNIEAYPDPSPPIVEIIAQWPGQSPEEVERYITMPIEIAVSSTPGLKFIRSNTVFALGFIRLQFEYGQDYYFVRQQALNRLRDANLPQGVQPVISPAGGISEIYRYQVTGPPDMDVMQLKTLQDWVIERRLRTVAGVADVAVLGGDSKEYQVEVDLNRLIAYGLTLPQVINAISSSNSNVGGRTISIGEQSVNVRGLGLIGSVEDISNIVLTSRNGVPVLVSNVAKIEIGAKPRLGMSGRDDKTNTITGIVLMQKLERTMEVVTRVRAAVEKLNTDGSLPAGVKLEAFYDRGDLVALTIDTVLHNLLFGIALIFLIQWVFLGDLRCALIVAGTIPVALFLAVMITVWRGESANLLSVGAIDLGIIVDATVIMVENIHRHLSHHVRSALADSDSEARLTDKLNRILKAAIEVDKAILFSVLITIAAFIPLFTMTGVEGQIFSPMARTYAYALIGAVLATFLVTPVLSSVLLPAHVKDVETFVVRGIRAVYSRVLPWVVGHARKALVIALVFLTVTSTLGARLGTEFLPKLEEGNLWIRATLPPTIALEAGMDTVARIREVIKSYPPVLAVVSEQGRGEEGTDPDGSFLAEFFCPLKPFDQWPKGLTKEKLVKELSERLNQEFVGVDFNFSQYIQDNMEEAVSGVKGENSIKIFGPDLATLERLSKEVKARLSEVPGVRDPGVFSLLGQPNLVIRIDRARAARYGFTVSDINAVIQAAIGGQEVTRVYEGEMNFALTVRLAPEFRRNVDAIRSIPVALPSDGTQTAYIALGELGEVDLELGAGYIYRENNQRFVPLKYSVRDRDLGSTVAEAQAHIAKTVPLPAGYSMEWSGEFGAMIEAQKRLSVIVPISLLLILLLLYSLFNSVRDSLLALAGIPFAVAGGILGLYVAGLNLSVSAAVGFISLFGVAAMDGILLMSYIRSNLDQGMGRAAAIMNAGETRMRQIFMTGLSACIGLVPAAFSTGIGSQVQQPLACVIVGGMLLSPICSLLIIPMLASILMPDSDAAEPEEAQAAGAGAQAAPSH